jgi:hypothetical protein
MNLNDWQAKIRHNYMPSIMFKVCNITSEFGDYHEGEH